MLFEPDTEKGNRGPADYATIREGKYDTREDGQGTIGGPHLVRVTGAEKGASEGSPVDEARIKRLFPEFATSVNMPQRDTTQDIEVTSGR